MVYDDGTAGVIGSGRSGVEVAPNPDTRPPTSISADQVSAAAGNSMVREPVTDFHRDGALTAVSTATALGTTVPAPGAVCADARNPTQ